MKFADIPPWPRPIARDEQGRPILYLHPAQIRLFAGALDGYHVVEIGPIPIEKEGSLLGPLQVTKGGISGSQPNED